MGSWLAVSKAEDKVRFHGLLGEHDIKMKEVRSDDVKWGLHNTKGMS